MIEKSTLKVLMVYEPTSGMAQDAKVLISALNNLEKKIDAEYLTIPWDETLNYNKAISIPESVQRKAPFDVSFHFEHLYGHHPLRSKKFSKYKVFIPNVEWIYPQDELEVMLYKPDAIFHKNDFSRELCKKISSFNLVNMNKTIGWSTIDFDKNQINSEEKDFRRFIHIRGESDQKYTSIIVDIWADNPDFPMLLIVTSGRTELPNINLINNLKNINLIVGFLDQKCLRLYQNQCGVHVYPSILEGYGHSLNEARICRSVLVTTDGPPMNTLVDNFNTGFLIPANSYPIRRSIGYEIIRTELEAAIKSIISLPEAKLKSMGLRARAAYLSDSAKFFRNIYEIFSSDNFFLT